MEPNDKPKFNWKRLLITVGIVIVTTGVIGGSVYYVMNQQAQKDKESAENTAQDFQKQIDDLKKNNSVATTTDTTSDWETYNDPTYNFGFKYPTNYVVTKTPGENNKFVTFSVDDFQVVVYPSDLSLDAFVRDQAQSYLVSNYQKINFSRQSAYEGIDQGMTSAYVVYLKNKGYIYRLILNTNGKDTLPELKAGLTTEQKQILSTFKIY